MSWISQLKDSLTRKKEGHDLAENDAPADTGVAAARDTGGDADEDAADAGSTTGTGESETFVGRVSGQDEGYAGQTGAEARAEADDDGSPQR